MLIGKLDEMVHWVSGPGCCSDVRHGFCNNCLTGMLDKCLPGGLVGLFDKDVVLSY